MQVDIVKSKKDVELAHPIILESFLTVGAKAKLQEAHDKYMKDAVSISFYRKTAVRYLFMEGLIKNRNDGSDFIRTAVRQGRYLEINKDEEE